MNTICVSWQGLLQMLVYLTSRGYYFYCPILLSMNKQEKWEKTDAKLMQKYQVSRSKFQRCRRKEQGFANFYYLRWQHIGFILHSQGIIGNDICYDDTFIDIRRQALQLSISENTALCVYIGRAVGNKLSVSSRMSPAMFKGAKAVLSTIVKSKNIRQICYEFNKLNGIPAYAGIIEQKRALAAYVVKQAQRHQLPLKASQLRIYTHLHRYKVFTKD